jgi:hypothetical protein
MGRWKFAGRGVVAKVVSKFLKMADVLLSKRVRDFPL